MNAPSPVGTALLAFENTRLPITSKFAETLGVTAGQWQVLVDQLFPSAKTVQAVSMALAYCKSRNLDIFKKPVHIVPMWSSAKNAMVETVWPGIAEIRTTAARTGEYAGIDAVEFGPMLEREFFDVMDKWVEVEGQSRKQKQQVEVKKKVRYPEWASVVVYRLVGRDRCAYHAKVFWEETYASVGKTDVPNDMWAKRPRGQLDKCVEAAALRKAFPEELGNIYAAEEMEGRSLDTGNVIEHVATKTPPKPPVPPVPPVEQVEQESNIVDAEVEEQDFNGDITEGEGEIDDTEFFEQLDDAMAEAKDIETIEELWTEADPLARFEGDEINQGIAKAIKKRALKRVGG